MNDAQLNLERAILAVIMDGRTPGCVDTLLEHAPHPLVFSERNHQLLYFAIAKAGDTCDAVSMAETASRLSLTDCTDWLARYRQWLTSSDWSAMGSFEHRKYRGLYQWAGEGCESTVLDAVGGFPYLADLAGAYTSAAGYRRNCQALAAHWDQRYLQIQLQHTLDELGKPDGIDQLDSIRARIMTAAGQVSGSDDSISTPDQVVDQMIEAAGREFDEATWGLDKLDKDLPLRRNALYVLAGRPANGKSSLAAQAVRQTAAACDWKPGRVAVVTLEMDRNEYVAKMCAQHLGVADRDASECNLDGTQRETMRQYAKQMGPSVVINDGTVCTIDAVRKFARAHHRKYRDFHLLVIDHLHIMSYRGDDQVTGLGEITRGLKILSKELDICVLLLAQLNRGNVREKVRPPRLSDLRGSGSIEQDANNVVFVHRDDGGLERKPEAAASIIVAKNRFGPIGQHPCTFRAAYGGAFVSGQTGGIPVDDPYGISKRYGGQHVNAHPRKHLEPDASEDLFG